MIRMFEYYDKKYKERYLYKYINFSEFEQSDLVYFPIAKVKKNYYDIGAAFDIETSKIPGYRLSFMYVWQFALNDLCIIGRTWEEFGEFLDLLRKFYKLDQKHILLVLDHNFSFEWQFIKKRIEWDEGQKGFAKVFALEDSRKVIKAEAAGIEFRDTLALTNISLEKLAIKYQLKYKKLTGDLDYSITRFSDTELDEQKDLPYMLNDVLILTDFYHKFIKKFFIDQGIKIPLTSTGIVRDELKRSFNNLPKLEREAIKNEISKCFPDFKLYEIMQKYLMRGGLVHSAPGNTDDLILFFMGGFDKKSAYPWEYLSNLFPWEFVETMPANWIHMLDKKATKKEAYFGHFTIKNIKSRGIISYETQNKIEEYSGAVWDNGRLYEAKEIRVWLTEADLINYFLCYDLKVEDISCDKLYKSIKKPLPNYLKDIILKYYILKEKIGKIDRNSGEYAKAKSDLNQIHGMICTALYFKENRYNSKTGTFESRDSEKSYNELINNQILLPQWSIWCMAYVRAEIVSFFAKCGGDGLYSDTDSIKLKNYLNNIYIFDDYNRRVDRINKKMYVGNYDRSYFMECGKMIFENKLYKFKTLGAKRYLYSCAEYDKESQKIKLINHTTVSGMKKGAFEKYTKKENVDIYSAFKDGLILDLSSSMKLTSFYCDKEFEIEYDGHIIKELSCVTLAEIPFKINIKNDYLRLIEEIKKLNQNKLVQKTYINSLI